MGALIDLFDAELAKKSRDEWGKIFDDAGLIWGPVMGLHEVPQDPHAVEIGMFPKIEHPEHGPYTTVNIPMRFATADVKPQGPAPSIGQHTDEILALSGFSEAEISALKEAKIVGSN
jgi:crotonobetainyl-CoA:carnitine CoA-transferase CaiB-like acyl-CoA transferase